MLDGLRGVAILFVVVDHVGLPGRGGAVGVTLFFVLSGFLITDLLIKERDSTGSIALRTFYARRALRLLPALFVYLVGSAVLAHMAGRDLGWIWKETWPPLTYVSNYAQALGHEVQMHWHTWSLAVEEHFYLIWPLVILFIPKSSRFKWLGASAVLLGAWAVVGYQLDSAWSYVASDTNAYGFVAGGLLAFGHERLAFVRVAQPLPFLGVLSLVALAAVNPSAIWQPAVVLVSTLTIWACVKAREPGLLSDVRLRFFGRISYALYLWHIPILMFAVDGVQGRILAAVVAIGIAYLSWIVIERPILSWRNRHVIARTASHRVEVPMEGQAA